MNAINLPLIVDPNELEATLGQPGLLITDLSKPEVHAQYHIPGAVPLNYTQIVMHLPPVMGLLPDAEDFSAVLAKLGMNADTHVVAYDDEGGGKASRLLWTLAAFGHTRYSLLNGGLHAWANEGHKLVNTPTEITPGNFQAGHNATVIAEQAYIQSRLGASDLALLDCRSEDEFNGNDVRAEHGGHIPGAVNLDWMLALDQSRNLRLKDNAVLESMLAERGIGKDKEVITYCHSHHRSALLFVVLQSLGYQRVRGYPGSWSDWGNQQDTPIE